MQVNEDPVRNFIDFCDKITVSWTCGHNFQNFTAPVDREQIYQWILELASPETRETALLELSKKREVVPDLAPMLWHSYGTIAALLQEIIAIYPAINPPVLTAHQSNRVCNALGEEKYG